MEATLEIQSKYINKEEKLLQKFANILDEYKTNNKIYKNILKQIFSDEEFKKCSSYGKLYNSYYPHENKKPYIIDLPDHTKIESLNYKSKKITKKPLVKFPLKLKYEDNIYIIYNNKIYNDKGIYVGIINDSIIINNKTLLINNVIDKNILSSYKNYDKENIIIDNDNNLFKQFGHFVFLIGLVQNDCPKFYDD
jgi:hypothetical protein